MAQASCASLFNECDRTNLAQRLSDVENTSPESTTSIIDYRNFVLLPLHVAVKTLEEEGTVPHVLNNAKIAKQNVRDVPDGLTKDERAAIYLYTMDWHPRDQTLSIRMNAALRTRDQKQVVPYFAYLKLFLTALSRLPSIATTVWRGIAGDLSEDYLTGMDFVWWGFSSCTESLDLLESDQFLGKSGKRTLFNIQCQSGKDIRAHSYFMGEGEILLLPGTRFQVLGKVNPAPGFHIIHVKETGSATTPSSVNAKSPNETCKSKQKKHSEKPKIEKSASGVPKNTKEDVASPTLAVKVTSLGQMFDKEKSTTQKTVPLLNKTLKKGSVPMVASELPKYTLINTQVSDVSIPKVVVEVSQSLPKKDVFNASQLPSYNNKDLEELIYMNCNGSRVSFWNKNLNDQDADIILSELMVNVYWTQIVLSCNSLGIHAANGFAEVLALKSTIRQLFLDNNHLGDEGTTRLAWSLGLNRTLVELRLDVNGITDSGALELAAALYFHPTIEKLSLSGNVIGDKGMKAFVKMLANNNTLLELNLSSNRITDECLKDILKLLKRQGNLEFLDLRNNQLSDESNSAIIRAIDQFDILRGQSRYGVEKLVSEVKDQSGNVLLVEAVFSKIAIARISLESQIQSLNEELYLLPHLHQIELDTIQTASLCIDVSAFYRTELVRAIAGIRDDFNKLSKAEKAELTEHYRIKIEEKCKNMATVKGSSTSKAPRKSFLQLITSIRENADTYTRLQNEHLVTLREYEKLPAVLRMTKEYNAILINDQEIEIRELEASIIYLTDCYCQTKLKNAYLQVEVNTYRKLIQAK
ncbi:hypothetical protein I4U23_017191 [Adineta vaga]|nr:hypothetical protein I4U23_017191 [Adineta vaga]